MSNRVWLGQPALAGALAIYLGSALAQGAVTLPQADASAAEAPRAAEKVVEEIVVTGSYIRRQQQADLPSPLQTIGALDIGTIGAQNIADITQTLTINTGAQNNPDAFTQNATTGTSNINLRGLGVGSTLVLLNGRRQVLTGQPTNDGVNFVDTASLVPLIAVDRIEILKDGASALYGSDAVAGVANFITRSGYDGALFSAEYTAHDSTGDYDEFNLQGLYGTAFAGGDLMFALSYIDRSALTTGERRLSRQQDDTSALGNPGAFFGNPDAPNPALPTIDPGCAANGGIPLPASAAAAPLVEQGFGFCGFDFGDFFNLVPDHERLTGFAQANFDFASGISAQIELGYADNSSIRGNSPTFPFLRLDRAVVPDFHPNTIFDDNVAFFGRASGNGGVVSPNFTESQTSRLAASLNGELAATGGEWSLSYAHARNEFSVRTEDTVTDRFACALAGFGQEPDFEAAIGLDCTAANSFLTANGDAVPATGTFFNPFASSFDTAPNPAALLDYLTEFQTRAFETTLDSIEAVVSGEWGQLGAGPLGYALGLQYRDNQVDASFDAISEGDGFAFLVGEQAYSGNQDSLSLFGELALALTPTLDLQLALRHEDYGGQAGSTTDPKIALLSRPNDQLSLRASYASSFRAPSVFQQLGQGTTLQQIIDPLNSVAFVAVRQNGNPDLAPERSDAFNLGLSFEPVAGLMLDLDYFHFDFTDVIVPENPQAIVDANPNDPRVIRAPSDTDSGTILQINTGFVNASSVKTSGVDFGVSYLLEPGDWGSLTPSLNATYLLDYELEDPQAGRIDGAGQRNFRNFGTSAPELRLNAGLAWQHGLHSANLYLRHISSYDDDQPATGTAPIDSDTRIDLQYALDVSNWLAQARGATLILGVRNLSDETAPRVATNGGFDSKVADPRGRLLYLGTSLEF